MTLKSVDHALAILEILLDCRDAGVSELARRLGVAPSTVHRTLATLSERGFVARSGSSRYRIGPAVTGVREIEHDADYIELAHDVMVDLSAMTGETVHLAVLDGRTARYLHVVESAQDIRLPSRVGYRIPVHASSAGKVLLAGLTSQIINSMLPTEQLVVTTPATIPTRTVLRRELAMVRLSGYARVVEEWERGVSAVAVAVPGLREWDALAFAVGGPQSRLRFTDVYARAESEAHLLKHLRWAADAIRAQISR